MNLINHWKLIWWRRWSTWLAGVNALFVTYIFARPDLLVGLLAFMPTRWIMPLALFLGLMAFGLPVLVASISQPKIAAKVEEKNAPAQSE